MVEVFFGRRCGRVEGSEYEERGECVGFDETFDEVDMVLFPGLDRRQRSTERKVRAYL